MPSVGRKFISGRGEGGICCFQRKGGMLMDFSFIMGVFGFLLYFFFLVEFLMCFIFEISVVFVSVIEGFLIKQISSSFVPTNSRCWNELDKAGLLDLLILLLSDLYKSKSSLQKAQVKESRPKV